MIYLDYIDHASVQISVVMGPIKSKINFLFVTGTARCG